MYVKNDTGKGITHLLPAQAIDMGGFPVRQALPSGEIRQVDPFLLLHHARVSYNKDKKALDQGIGPHPHRGFSPVTFVVRGDIHHRDSLGNDQVATEGEVQWMNAGAGVVHSERPSEKLVNLGGTQEVIQLWINTPAAHKMNEPVYQFLKANDMPSVYSEDGNITSKLVCGSMYGVQNQRIRTFSDITILWGKATDEGVQKVDIPEGMNAMIYVIRGRIRMDADENIEKHQLAVLQRNLSTFSLQCEKGTEFLFLAGKPLHENVIQYGPFVMNSRNEILEAMDDYQSGKMGVLTEVK